MKSLLELSGEVRSHLSLAHSFVGSLDGLDGSHLLVSLTAQFSCTIPSFVEEGRPSMAGQGCLLHTIWSGVTLSTDGPWVSIQWQCLWLQIVECSVHCMLSVWFHRAKSSWLAICSDRTGEQLGKDMKWHNINTCTSVPLHQRLP